MQTDSPSNDTNSSSPMHDDHARDHADSAASGRGASGPDCGSPEPSENYQDDDTDLLTLDDLSDPESIDRPEKLREWIQINTCALRMAAYADQQDHSASWESLAIQCRRIARNIRRLTTVDRELPDSLPENPSREIELLDEWAENACLNPLSKRKGRQARKSKAERESEMRERNEKARNFLIKNPDATLRNLAKHLDYSASTVNKLIAWKTVMAQREPSRRTTAPPARSLTDAELDRNPEGKKDEVLLKLIEEQERDHEPSPLEDDPKEGRRKSVRAHKKA